MDCHPPFASWSSYVGALRCNSNLISFVQIVSKLFRWQRYHLFKGSVWTVHLCRPPWFAGALANWKIAFARWWKNSHTTIFLLYHEQHERRICSIRNELAENFFQTKIFDSLSQVIWKHRKTQYFVVTASEKSHKASKIACFDTLDFDTGNKIFSFWSCSIFIQPFASLRVNRNR